MIALNILEISARKQQKPWFNWLSNSYKNCSSVTLQFVPIYTDNLFLNLSRFSILSGILYHEKLTAQSSIRHRTEGNNLSYLPLPRHLLLHACLCRLSKRPERITRDRVQNIYTVKYDILKLMSLLGSTAEELWTELLTKHASQTSHSCCEIV